MYTTYAGIIYLPPNFKKIDIVIAVYEEDISWISLLPKELYNHIYIYNKGSNKHYSLPNVSFVDLPNVGYEAHTYLYHIINNYNKLGDKILFIPGTAWTKAYKRHKMIKTIHALANGNDSAAIGYDVPFLLSLGTFYNYQRALNAEMNVRIFKYNFTNEANKVNDSNMKVTPASIHPYGNWFKHHFKEDTRCLTYNGIFAVSRDNILKRSREFYQRLLREIDYPQAEVGHYMERSWATIVSIPQNQCFQHRPNPFYYIMNGFEWI